MNGTDDVLDPPDCSDRRNLAFFVAKTLAVLGYRFLTSVHLEMDPEILPLRRREGTVFFYVGLHKSLWETSGILVPLYRARMPLPYVGMGDNLIHGRLFQELSKKVGTFLIRRPANRQEVLESARHLRKTVLGFLVRGLDILVFPEGTRKSVPTRAGYGDFFPAPFEPLLEYERNKERLCAANPGCQPKDAYIVPFNVDYSCVREAHEMVAVGSGKPQTLNVFDSLSMLRHIGGTYVTYGAPVRVAGLLDLDRKKLAVECRRMCMDLVKILPINVASLAMLRLPEGAPFTSAALEREVAGVVAALKPHADRFRGFTPGEAPAEIIRLARHGRPRFEGPDPEELPLYRLYAAYIRHYLPPDPRPEAALDPSSVRSC